jgi:hypothetical protein
MDAACGPCTPAFREASKDSRSARGVALPRRDGRPSPRGTTTRNIYVDFCHFRERGNDLLADEIAGGPFLRGTAAK